MNMCRNIFFALLFCAAVPAHAIDLWGTVVWKNGAPATGIELRLLQKETVISKRIFTNSAGRYGLYGLVVPTTNYKLQVLRNGIKVKEVKLPSLANSAQIPNIVMP